MSDWSSVIHSGCKYKRMRCWGKCQSAWISTNKGQCTLIRHSVVMTSNCSSSIANALKRGREKPYHRCSVVTMSLQFLAQETIGGVSLHWFPALQRHTASIRVRSEYACILIGEVGCTQTRTLWKVKKCCVCPFPWMRDVMLSSAALSGRSSLQQDRLWAGRNHRHGSDTGGQGPCAKHGDGVKNTDPE